MAQVTVKINGYSYTVGCEDGQEDHLNAMAAQVESRIDSIKALGSSSGEARLLVLASLLMADELHDTKTESDELRGMLAKAGPTKSEPVGEKPAGEAVKEARRETGRKVSRLAARAEQIANGLEQP